MTFPRLGIFLFFLCMSSWGEISELWHTDVVSSSRGLAAYTGAEGDAPLVVFSTRFDGTLWALDSRGEVQRSIPRPQWLEGSVTIARSSYGPVAVVQESTGRVCTVNLASGEQRDTEIPGTPAIGTAPCIAEVDGQPGEEIIVGRTDGTITALDRNLVTLWRYNGGATFEGSPVAGPLLYGEGAIFAQDVNGVIHCVSGSGLPLWTYALPHSAPEFPSIADLLIVVLPTIGPAVLASDALGWLYAIDAVNGTEFWRAHVGSAALGAPAMLNVTGGDDPEIVTVSERGEISILNAAGESVLRGALPAGHYLPRPLIADVDADGALELLVATRDWRILVADLAGTVEQELTLRGSAREGIVLADINADGFLELIAVTDCARAHCFATQARAGWTHPRGSDPRSGCSGSVARSAPRDRWGGLARLPRNATLELPVFNRDVPFANGALAFPAPNSRRWISVVIRDKERIIGSCSQQLTEASVSIPLPWSPSEMFELSYLIGDREGKVLSRGSGLQVQPSRGIPVALPPREEFVQVLDEVAGRYRMPDAWALPVIAGRDRWNIVTHMPEQWRTYGIADEPFIRDAALRVMAPATSVDTVFRPGHPAWDPIAQSDKPFFVQNEYFRPTQAYPQDAYAEILKMGGSRFLGFQVHEWAYQVWKKQLESAENPPDSLKEATRIMRRDFEVIRGRSHGKIYAGEGYCFVAHQAYSWGATMCYAEIGENMPCLPLQLASIRGASRQWDGKPWGAYLSNWFRGAVLDTRHGAALKWNPPEDASGPDCGHSSSLEFRMALAAHLAGATFVHHESDAHNGSVFVRETEPGQFSLSEHGAAFKRAYDAMEAHPDRGVPYTPIAFLMPFDHGWRWNQPIYGIWPQDRAARGTEAVFGHVFPWGGRLDFERGYMANSPYGDVMDVLSLGKRIEAVNSYAVAWPIGVRQLASADRRALIHFVEEGGVLIVDSALADSFPATFLGVDFSADLAYSTGLQTALAQPDAVTAPFQYQPMRLGRNARPLAWSDSGSPVLAWHRVGRGLVVVSGTHHWLSEDNGPAPVVAPLLRTICDSLVPITWLGDAQVHINRTAQGWVVGLINNKGVTKVPTAPAAVDPEKSETCLITYRGTAPRGFVTRLGDAVWDMGARGILVNIPPGDAAIVELLTE